MAWSGRALGALCAAVAASAAAAPASHAVPPEVFTWKDLRRVDLKVTEGSIGTETGGLLGVTDTRLRTTSWVMRAVQARGPWARHARLRFLYHGRLTSRPPGPGIWPQIGLKLRTPNTCNVLYVMWHQHVSQVVVTVKRNPGLDTHAECTKVPGHGYTTLREIPVPRDHRFGGWQTLEARTAATPGHLDLQVFANGREVFHDLLFASQFGPFTGVGALDGPIGLRSDGGSFSFSLGREP